MLIPSIIRSLTDLSHVVAQLSESQYTAKCAELSNATIGEHARHIIEMFQCLQRSYDAGIVDYDTRERSIVIQNHTDIALTALLDIQQHLIKDNKSIILHQMIEGEEIRIESNYYRELLYNLEHCIHHQALIKVAVRNYSSVNVNADFGVARSTIAYRNQCAQ